MEKNNYSYKEFTYQNTVTQRIALTCNTCGNEWNIDLNAIRGGKTSCIDCRRNDRKLSQEEAERRLNDASKGEYTYKPFYYDGIETEITCVCKKCNRDFTNTFSKLVYSKTKCCHCYGCLRTSKAEKEVFNFIKEEFKNIGILENERIIPGVKRNNSKLELDIYIPEINLAIEYNGTYWHSDEKIIEKSKGYFKNADEYHQYKTDKCLEMGIDLIHIFEKDYMENRDIVLNKIKQEILKRL